MDSLILIIFANLCVISIFIILINKVIYLLFSIFERELNKLKELNHDLLPPELIEFPYEKYHKFFIQKNQSNKFKNTNILDKMLIQKNKTNKIIESNVFYKSPSNNFDYNLDKLLDNTVQELYLKYKNQFVCTDLKNPFSWYKFENNAWIDDSYGYELKKIILETCSDNILANKILAKCHKIFFKKFNFNNINNILINKYNKFNHQTILIKSIDSYKKDKEWIAII